MAAKKKSGGIGGANGGKIKLYSIFRHESRARRRKVEKPWGYGGVNLKSEECWGSAN